MHRWNDRAQLTALSPLKTDRKQLFDLPSKEGNAKRKLWDYKNENIEAILTFSDCFCCVESEESVCSSSDVRWREDCNREARSSASPEQSKTRPGGNGIQANNQPGLGYYFITSVQLSLCHV